jgi:hypothetical protein
MEAMHSKASRRHRTMKAMLFGRGKRAARESWCVTPLGRATYTTGPEKFRSTCGKIPHRCPLARRRTAWKCIRQSAFLVRPPDGDLPQVEAASDEQNAVAEDLGLDTPFHVNCPVR